MSFESQLALGTANGSSSAAAGAPHHLTALDQVMTQLADTAHGASEHGPNPFAAVGLLLASGHGGG